MRSRGCMMKIERLPSVSSTNEYLRKYLPARENVAVFADVQTAGRGTKGRSFLSDMGGVYLSILVFYADMAPANAFRIMAHAAVSVCRTLGEYGIPPEIKWPNDVRVSGKKIAGILIENGLREGKIDHSVIGIGMNVTNDVSALGGIAVNMAAFLRDPPSAEEVGRALLENFRRPSTFGEYLSHAHFLGERIRVAEREEEYFATARRILPDGRLEIERGGEIFALSSAEITIGN